MAGIVAQYREYAPCEALREHVRGFYSFTPPGRESSRRPAGTEVLFAANDSFASPMFADPAASLAFSFELRCAPGGTWRPAGRAPVGDAIGPTSAVGAPAPGELPETFGAYLRTGCSFSLTGVPAPELTDRIVPFTDLGIPSAADIAPELAAMKTDDDRIARLESFLLAQLAARDSSAVENRLVNFVVRANGHASIEHLAAAAGVSRQHLTRVFRDHVGVGPKRFARLIRFHAGLAYVASGKKLDWAQAALDLGYADQSHMIAEFREFCSLTPESFVRRRWFHPFIERARRRV